MRQITQRDIEDLKENIAKDRRDLETLQREKPRLESEFRRAEESYQKIKEALEKNTNETSALHQKLAGLTADMEHMQKEMELALRSLQK